MPCEIPKTGPRTCAIFNDQGLACPSAVLVRVRVRVTSRVRAGVWARVWVRVRVRVRAGVRATWRRSPV